MRVVLADDHEVVRKGIRSIIDQHSPWTVCGEAANGEEAVNLVLGLKPDLAVLDLSMPVMNGLQATAKIRQLVPATKILILSMHDSPQTAREALAVGADAFLTKTVSPDTLICTVTKLFGMSPN